MYSVDIKDLRVLHAQRDEAPFSIEYLMFDAGLSNELRERLQQQYDRFVSQDTEEVATLKVWYVYNLSRNNYPIIFSRSELEEILQKLLNRTANQIKMMERGNKAIYNEHTIPKKDGGERILLEPHGHLKKVQRWILEEILNKLNETF